MAANFRLVVSGECQSLGDPNPVLALLHPDGSQDGGGDVTRTFRKSKHGLSTTLETFREAFGGQPVVNFKTKGKEALAHATASF